MKKPHMLTSSLAALALAAGATFPAAAETVEFCSTTTPKDIPDEERITDSIVVPSGIGTIDDLNVYVDISHTHLGDLVIELGHNGTTTTLVHRPKLASVSSCPGHDIQATFDDEASLAAQDACKPENIPAISGSVIGGDPPNSSQLASYDDRDIGGTWTLTVSDEYEFDFGTLQEWCLIAEVSSLDQAMLATCGGFAPPSDAAIGLGRREQRVIPLRMEIFDDDGFPLGLADITAPTVSVSYAVGNSSEDLSSLVDSPGNATPGNSFRWDAATERWAFNLSTKPYTAAGTYTVTAVAGDAEYVLDPTCTGTFVRQ